MRRIRLSTLPGLMVALCLVGAGGKAGAEPRPYSPAADPRVRVFDYASSQIYRIVGAPRSATQLIFGSDEAIEHVALGDSEGWEVAPEGSALFLKPRRLSGSTNLIVTTRRGQEDRHYAFELVVRPSGAFYQVRFRYPADMRARSPEALSAEAAQLQKMLIQLRLDQAVLEGRRNLSYSLRGPASLSPLEVTDNGRFTVLRFAPGTPLPAIYALSEDGVESVAPFDVRGEFIVLHAVYPGLRLKRGRERLCIINDAYAPDSRAGSGAATDSVRREIRKGGAP